MIIGVDKGSTYTKTSKGIMLRSTVRPYSDSEIKINDNTLVVELFGNKYVVGGIGNYSTDLRKAEHENTKILVYTAIAESFEDELIRTNLVLGLPIGQYSRNKAKMKNLFSDKGVVEIKINGKEKTIIIQNVEVFPEAAGAYFAQDIKDCLIIDIGGLSVDNALFKNGKLVANKYSTYPMGTMKLFSKLANFINSNQDLSLCEWDIPGVLEKGLYIYGKKIDIDLESIIITHVKQIMERLKLEYDLKVIDKIIFTGGGSTLLFDYFKQYMPQASLMDDTEFSNSKGFEIIGQALFRD